MWRAEIARTDGSEQTMARLRYASELLAVGETESAIGEIERLMQDAGPEGNDRVGRRSFQRPPSGTAVFVSS